VNQIAINGLSYWEPGYSHHYSNTGYTILSEIIARVYSANKTSGKTYKDYLFDYIYGPHSIVPLDLYFPAQATDVAINELHATGVIYYPEPEGTVYYDQTNMSAHVAEGNGYANFTELNTYVRTLMKAQNVLEAETVTLMQTDFSPDVNGPGNYALGCIRTTNLGFGHNGCIRGYLSIMMYDPSVDVSVIVMMNAVDYRSEDNFLKNFTSMYDCAWKAREILGYPGKPAK
jgi:D-alanyl-D-alanine carboxypeptidase